MIKEKKETELSEFEIFERLADTGAPLMSRYPNKPLVLVGKNLAAVSPLGIKKIGIAKDSRLVFSKRNEIGHIASLPITSNINGYKVQRINRSKQVFIASKSLIKRGFQEGYYEIKEPIFAGGIDWFELEPFHE